MGIRDFANKYSPWAIAGQAFGLPELGISEIFSGKGIGTTKKAISNAKTRAAGANAAGMNPWEAAFTPNSTVGGQNLYNAGVMTQSFGGDTPQNTQQGSNSPYSPVGVSDFQNSGSSAGGTGMSSLDQMAYDREIAEANKRIEQLNQARSDYEKQFGINQQRRTEANQYATDQYNTAVARATDKKGEIERIYGRTRGEMGDQAQMTQNQLASSYSARGLSDSSFAGKARAEADKSFQRSLTLLNEDQASQIKQVDDYLSDIGKQREFQLKQLTWEDFDNAEDYQKATKALQDEITEIEDQKNYLRRQVEEYGKTLSAQQPNTFDRMTEFSKKTEGILSASLPKNDKKTLLSNVFVGMGRKDPERDADYYMDWYEANQRITSGSLNPDQANELFQTNYGVKPF